MAEITPPSPLSEQDDRSQFDCGRDSLNIWLRRHGWHNHAAGLSRVSVVRDAETAAIVGYVSLSAAHLERQFVVKTDRRNAPNPMPHTLLGQLAVGRRYQGQGHARSLLLFALTTALNASRFVGSFGVITHPLEEEVRGFYRRWGFEDILSDPKRSMIVRMVDLQHSGIAG